MPLYMDIHELHGASADDVAKAHMLDLEAQQKYGVNYRKYWFNEKVGKAFCLVDAPSAEAATCVHREAHGLLAERIIEIEPELAEGFLGGVEVESGGRSSVTRWRRRCTRSRNSNRSLHGHRELDHLDSIDGR